MHCFPGGMGQYAVAFRVEKNKCQDSNYSGQDLITQQVKDKLQNNEVYVSGNLIAAKADKNIQIIQSIAWRIIWRTSWMEKSMRGLFHCKFTV